MKPPATLNIRLVPSVADIDQIAWQVAHAVGRDLVGAEPGLMWCRVAAGAVEVDADFSGVGCEEWVGRRHELDLLDIGEAVSTD
jgi:hypothetical protein